MSRTMQKLPGRAARFWTGLSGFLLTLLLFLTVVSLLCHHWFTSEALHTRIATDDRVVEEQMRILRERTEALAEEYGFSPETVMREISAETIREADRAAALRLTKVFREGKLEDVPAYDAEPLSEALQADAAFMAGQDPFMLKNTLQGITGAVGGMISDQAMVFREPMIRAAERMAQKTVQLPVLAEICRQLPLLFALAAAAVTGLIGLLTSRKMRLCLRYIGSAMTASAMLLVGVLGLFFLLNLGPLMNEISLIAGRRFHLLTLYISGETLAAACLLLIPGIIGSRIGRGVLR